MVFDKVLTIVLGVLLTVSVLLLIKLGITNARLEMDLLSEKATSKNQAETITQQTASIDSLERAVKAQNDSIEKLNSESIAARLRYDKAAEAAVIDIAEEERRIKGIRGALQSESIEAIRKKMLQDVL